MPSPFHRPNVRLDLEVRSGSYFPGDDVNVQVSLVPQESFYVREGLVELACTETYDISHSEGAPTKHTHDLWRSTLPLMQEERVLDGQTYGGDFKFTVPADALPTVKGQAAEIIWAVLVSLDVAMARDIHRQRQLRVLSPAPESARADVVEEAYPQCELWLSLSEVTVPAGGAVEGKFTVQVWQDLKVQQIRIELECLEKAGDKTASTIKDQMVLRTRNRYRPTRYWSGRFACTSPSSWRRPLTLTSPRLNGGSRVCWIEACEWTGMCTAKSRCTVCLDPTLRTARQVPRWYLGYDAPMPS